MAPLPETVKTRSDQRSLWRNRNYLLLWCGQMISTVGSGVSDLAFPLLVLAMTGSPVQAGLVATLETLVGSLVLLPAGVLVDRWDRKLVMLCCDLCRFLSMASIPIALTLGHLTIFQLSITALIEGTLGRSFSLAHSTALAQVVKNEHLTTAVALDEVTEGVTTLGGPSLGGLLFSLGRALPFLADAISYGVSIVTLLLVRTPLQGQRKREERHLLREMRTGIAWLWHQPFLRAMTLLMMSSALSHSGSSLAVIVLAEQHGASSWLIGCIFALGGAGSILGAFVASVWQKRFHVGRAILLTRWTFALLWPLYVLVPLPWMLGAVEFGIGFIDPVEDVAYFSYRLQLIPEELRGRVLSVCRLFPRLSGALGILLTGLFLQWFGAVPTLLAEWLILLLGAVVISCQHQFRQAGREKIPR